MHFLEYFKNTDTKKKAWLCSLSSKLGQLSQVMITIQKILVTHLSSSRWDLECTHACTHTDTTTKHANMLSAKTKSVTPSFALEELT